jgi:hypothetical protein
LSYTLAAGCGPGRGSMVAASTLTYDGKAHRKLPPREC